MIILEHHTPNDVVHHITVTGGGPFGRAWFDCTCGITRTHATRLAANDAALGHHRDVIGCGCTREAFDPACTARTRPCADCGAPVCDKACPSAAVAEHDAVLAEIDAWNDHATNTYPDERRSA